MSRHRAARIGLAALGLAMLLVPPLTIGLSNGPPSDVLWTSLRLAALEAFTLITANITIGAFRPLFHLVAKPRTIHRLHVTLGLAGFSVAMAHGVMTLVFGIAGYPAAPTWAGPAALAVLALALVTALTRRRFRRTWRWVHRLNYLVFAVVLIHGLLLGYDLGNDLFLKTCFGVYAAVVLAGCAYRVARATTKKTA